ncbi:hypothetical protein BC936DRAFT_146862 [Jimgerdemannia flammicorona]|uniref:Uncharacterized protein n=1 Tax=Jimgerdemannia flammicorona TaxID=994334 RepID=A0A433D6R3_9FUNG|nr:hypothetical protein BC936DRAFT_146862 [Jimgerdemannia flammicorona]
MAIGEDVADDVGLEGGGRGRDGGSRARGLSQSRRWGAGASVPRHGGREARVDGLLLGHGPLGVHGLGRKQIAEGLDCRAIADLLRVMVEPIRHRRTGGELDPLEIELTGVVNGLLDLPGLGSRDELHAKFELFGRVHATPPGGDAECVLGECGNVEKNDTLGRVDELNKLDRGAELDRRGEGKRHCWICVNGNKIV